MILEAGDITTSGCVVKGGVSGANITLLDIMASSERELILFNRDDDLIAATMIEDSSSCVTFPSSVGEVVEMTVLDEVASGSTSFHLNKFYSLQKQSPHVIGT